MERLTVKSSIIEMHSMSKALAGLLTALAFIIPASLSALEGLALPESGNVQILYTDEGSSFIGRIVEIGTESVRFQTSFGEITMGISQIKRIREVPENSIRNGKYWFPNPNSSRLILGPTGRPQGKGRGYASDYMLFFPYASYGITDNLSIAGGVTLIPGLGIGGQEFLFMPKIGFNLTDNLALSAGVIGLWGVGEYGLPNITLAYSAGTFGNPNASITAGIGYGVYGESGYYSGRDVCAMQSPAFMLGADFRLWRGVSFVTENYYVPDLDQIVGLSYGFRFFGERFSVDVVFLNMAGSGMFAEIFPGIPFIDVTYNF